MASRGSLIHRRFYPFVPRNLLHKRPLPVFPEHIGNNYEVPDYALETEYKTPKCQISCWDVSRNEYTRNSHSLWKTNHLELSQSWTRFVLPGQCTQ